MQPQPINMQGRTIPGSQSVVYKPRAGFKGEDSFVPSWSAS